MNLHKSYENLQDALLILRMATNALGIVLILVLIIQGGWGMVLLVTWAAITTIALSETTEAIKRWWNRNV